METTQEKAAVGFYYTVATLDKSTVFHQKGANELIGQLNFLFMNNVEYLKKAEHLQESERLELIEESTYTLLDAINCISAISEIYEYYTKYKRDTVKPIQKKDI